MDYFCDYTAAADTLNIVSECCISHAILTPRFDPERESATDFISLRTDIMKKLKRNKCIPKDLKLTPAAVVPLIQGISDIADFKCLAVEGTDRIYLSVPTIPDPECFDAEMHNILYLHRLRPVFCDFDAAAVLLADDQLYKIMSVPYSAFQFNISGIDCPPALKCIRRLVKLQRTVLFGTGIKNYGAGRTVNYNLPKSKLEAIFGRRNFLYYVHTADKLF